MGPPLTMGLCVFNSLFAICCMLHKRALDILIVFNVSAEKYVPICQNSLSIDQEVPKCFSTDAGFLFLKKQILWERISHLTMMSDFSKWPRLLYQCYFFCFVMTVTGNKKILPTSPRKVMCDLPSLSWTFTLHYFCTYCMLHLVT